MVGDVESSEKLVREWTLLGAALCSAQKAEFALYGIVAHLSHTPAAQKEKRFRTLTGEAFLRGDPADLKATLGQIVHLFGDTLLLTTEEVDRFCSDRNLIAHNYWRVFHSKVRGGVHREDPEELLVQFIRQAEHLQKVVVGLLRLIMSWLAEREDRVDEFPMTDQDSINLALFNDHVARHIAQQRSQP